MANYRTARSYIDEFLRDPDNARRVAEKSLGFELTKTFTRLRKEAHLSQAQLAKRVGRQQPYIAKLEAGAYDRCALPTLRTFARALGHDIDISRMFRRIEKPIYSGDVDVMPILDEALRRTETPAPFAKLRARVARVVNGAPPEPSDASTAHLEAVA